MLCIDSNSVVKCDKVLDGHRLYVALVCKCMVEPYRLIIDRPILSLVHIASYLNFTSLLYY